MTEDQNKCVPDVLLMTLEKAEEALHAAGVSFVTEETKPTRRDAVEGILRVIKQQNLDRETVLTVCKVPDAFHS